MAISNEVNEFLESISKTVSKETAEILTTVIGKEVTISKDKISELDMNEIKSTYPSEVLSVKFNISDRDDDLIYIIFEKDIAVKISAWMLMESEEGVEYSDEHLDSIRETANQILGHLSSVLNEELGRKFEFFSIRASVLDLESESIDISNGVAVEYTLNMGDEEAKKVTKLLSADVVERFLAGEEASAEEETEESSLEDEAFPGGDEEGVSEESDAESLADSMEGISDTSEEGPGLEESFDLSQEEESIEKAYPSSELLVAGEVPDNIAMLMDLSLSVVIELGRTRMLIKDILELGHGSVIEFDKLAGEPVDILVNNKKIAEGEVVVIDEHFGIRLTTLVKQSERIKQLGK